MAPTNVRFGDSDELQALILSAAGAEGSPPAVLPRVDAEVPAVDPVPEALPFSLGLCSNRQLLDELRSRLGRDSGFGNR